MRICVAIVGVPSEHRGRDWKRSFPNIRDNLLTGWPEDVTIDTFVIGCPIYDLDEFKEAYNPIKVVLDCGLIHGKYEIAVKLMNELDYDVYLIVRPDTNFLSHVSTWNIDFSKFNFVHKEYPEQLWLNPDIEDGKPFQIHSDNFFVVPGKYTQQFYDATFEMSGPIGLAFKKNSHSIEDINYKCMYEVGPMNHAYYPFIRKYFGEENIHCIDDRYLISCTFGNEKYYVLDRLDNEYDIQNGKYHVQNFYHKVEVAKTVPHGKLLLNRFPELNPANNDSVADCECAPCKVAKLRNTQGVV